MLEPVGCLTASATRPGSSTIEPRRAARLHVAEAAASGTDVPQDHKGGGLLVPAFADVGATGALAYRMQALLAHELFEFEIILAMWQFTLSQG